MIEITREQQKIIIEHAQAAKNHEACGILAGKNNLVEKVYLMKNTSDAPESCYFMEPKEQLQVMKEIRSNGLEMIGIYHSHPASEAYPSARDMELAFYPDAVYVIVSLRDKDKPEFKAFKIVEGKIVEEKVKA